jgi:hypothetical protein
LASSDTEEPEAQQHGDSSHLDRQHAQQYVNNRHQNYDTPHHLFVRIILLTVASGFKVLMDWNASLKTEK